MPEQPLEDEKSVQSPSKSKPRPPRDDIEQTYHSHIGDVRGLTGAQQAGVKLAWAVGSVIVLVTAYVVVSWYLMLPQVHPPLDASRDALDNFKELRVNAFDEAPRFLT